MTQDMKTGKILMVAYYYPPIAAAGSHRTMNFSRELKNMGWDVSVISCSDYKRNPVDPVLLDRIHSGIRIRRAPCTDLVQILGQWKLKLKNRKNGSSPRPEPASAPQVPGAPNRGIFDWISRLMKTPDSMLAFVPGVIFQALPIMMGARPDIIYSSAPPYSCHLAACCLKTLFNLPWVADFRDPWADNPFRRNNPYPSLNTLNTKMEAMVLKEADFVVANTPALERAFRERYPHMNRFVTISNGFDPELPLRLKDLRENQTTNQTRKIRLVHTGEVYGLRSPDCLIQALGALKKEAVKAWETIEIEFVGNIHEKERLSNLAASLGVESSIIYKGQVDHTEALKACSKADILLILGVAGPKPEIQTPSKLFEYFVLKKPIVSLSKKHGAIHGLLEQSQTPYLLADIEKSHEIKNVLDRMVKNDFDGGDGWEHVNEFSFDRLSARLANVLGPLIKGESPKISE